MINIGSVIGIIPSLMKNRIACFCKFHGSFVRILNPKSHMLHPFSFLIKEFLPACNFT